MKGKSEEDVGTTNQMLKKRKQGKSKLFGIVNEAALMTVDISNDFNYRRTPT